MLATKDHVLVLCTVPDDAVGEKLARGLVEARLAACVNRIPGVRSTYVWEGETKDDAEVQLLIKTHKDRLEGVTAFVEANHPYEVPELVAIPIVAGSVAYLSFLDESTRPT